MFDEETLKADLQRELQALRDTGQEVWLQASLGESQVRTELHRLEHRFQVAQEVIAHLGEQSKAAKDESVATVRRLISELEQGYARIQRGI